MLTWVIVHYRCFTFCVFYLRDFFKFLTDSIINIRHAARWAPLASTSFALMSALFTSFTDLARQQLITISIFLGNQLKLFSGIWFFYTAWQVRHLIRERVVTVVKQNYRFCRLVSLSFNWRILNLTEPRWCLEGAFTVVRAVVKLGWAYLPLFFCFWNNFIFF